MFQLSRRQFVQSSLIAGSGVVAGCLGDHDSINYEIWALDQGTDIGYIYQPTDHDEPSFEAVEELDFHSFEGIEPNEDGNVVPHMVSFSSDYSYAAVACTAAAQTVIFRTDDYAVVDVLDTGPSSHFAGFTPEDDAVVVDVIAESKIVRISADLEDESFEINDDIVIDESIDGLTDEEGAPICHSYDRDGRSYHTLGPSYLAGGLVVIDHDDFSVERAYSGDELPTNCGTVPHPEDDKFYLTAGLPRDPEADRDGVGEFYVLDTDTDQVIVDGADTGGIDAHGFWFTPDGQELWVLNRETNDGIIIDPDTDEVIEEIAAYGPETGAEPEGRDAPDIMWAEPNGDYLFVSLRGAQPVSGDPHAATGVTPGFSIIDIGEREIVDVIEPDGATPESDFHGIGVVPLDNVEELHTSPPYCRYR